MRKPKALLSDLDGTLVDSEAVLHRAAIEQCAAYGKDFSEIDYGSLIGRPDLEVCRGVIEFFGLAKDPHEWHREYKRRVAALMKTELRERPGAGECLARLAADGMPMALVTSANQEHAEQALGQLGFRQYFKVMVTADNPYLSARKPDPEPYRLAAKLLGILPSQCIAFEDSPAGVASAKAAGCFVFAVPHKLSRAERLTEAHVILPGGLAQFSYDLIPE